MTQMTGARPHLGRGPGATSSIRLALYDDTETALSALARTYAAGGWYVFPCIPRDKRPLVSNWPTLATADEKQVSEWWNRWPNANVAVACGPSNLVVVDIDPRNGGHETAQRIRDKLPDTALSWTGGGGWHLFYKGNSKTRPNAWPGIDIKSTGGYVLVPPSIHPDGPEYLWRGTGFMGDIAPWPNQLDPPTRVLPSGHVVVASGLTAYSKAALKGELERILAAPEGARNDALNRAAYSLGQLVASGDLPAEPTRQALESAGISAGLTAREVQSTVASGLRSAGSRVVTVTPWT